jgi:hypothetical protein
MVQGGIYFHPTDEKTSAGAPDGKMPLMGCGFEVRQLWNRCEKRTQAADGQPQGLTPEEVV